MCLCIIIIDYRDLIFTRIKKSCLLGVYLFNLLFFDFVFLFNPLPGQVLIFVKLYKSFIVFNYLFTIICFPSKIEVTFYFHTRPTSFCELIDIVPY